MTCEDLTIAERGNCHAAKLCLHLHGREVECLLPSWNGSSVSHHSCAQSLHLHSLHILLLAQPQALCLAYQAVPAHIGCGLLCLLCCWLAFEVRGKRSPQTACGRPPAESRRLTAKGIVWNQSVTAETAPWFLLLSLEHRTTQQTGRGALPKAKTLEGHSVRV